MKVEKYYCDRCKKELESYDDKFFAKRIFIKRYKIPVRFMRDNSKCCTYEYCYDCYKEICKFLEGKAND